jgi:mannose-6-phosphate isomerase-like protein (cupin superfamily)
MKGMNRVFEPRGYFRVPDGTDVSAFLNATDATQDDVPWGVLGEMSIAAGRISPGVHSWVHMHPAVTQVTYLAAGQLAIRMKDPSSAEPYELSLRVGQAVVSEPGTLFQLRNDGEEVADVLYIVSPSYVFEMEGNDVHDDAILVARTWEELASHDAPALKMTSYEARARHAESLRRLARRKGIDARALADQRSDTAPFAHHGLTMTSLVAGERGSLAHGTLAAGTTSAPVRHRTVEALCHVLEGAGEIWQHPEGNPPHVASVKPGDALRISPGTAFQLRASSDRDLKLLFATIPSWPGPQEAIPATGGFPPPPSR